MHEGRRAVILAALVLVASSSVAGGQLPAARPAPGVLLVASPDIPDPRFERAVVLLVAHDERGTLGLMLNRPAQGTPPGAPDTRHALYVGGPIAPERVAVVGRGEAPDGPSLTVTEGVWASVDQGVIDAALAADVDSGALRVFLGYCVWAPGQLQVELESVEAWDLFRAGIGDIFATEPERLWERLTSGPRLVPVGRDGVGHRP